MALLELKVVANDAVDMRHTLADLAAQWGSANTASPLSTADSASGSEGRPAPRKRRQPGGETSGVDAGKDGNGAAEAAGEAREQADDPAASGSTEEQAPANDDAPSATTYDDVRNAVVGLAAAKGRDAAIAVLDQFGVDHASKLTEAQWPEALAALVDAQGAA